MKINNKDYVDKAKEVMDKLRKTDRRGNLVYGFTTTKIRGLLSMTTDIYNEVLPLTEDELSDEIKGKINYLKVHFLYEAGRDGKGVGEFIRKANIIEYIDEIQGSRDNYLLFSRYMEALVAYFKFNGGRD